MRPSPIPVKLLQTVQLWPTSHQLIAMELHPPIPKRLTHTPPHLAQSSHTSLKKPHQELKNSLMTPSIPAQEPSHTLKPLLHQVDTPSSPMTPLEPQPTFQEPTHKDNTLFIPAHHHQLTQVSPMWAQYHLFPHPNNQSTNVSWSTTLMNHHIELLRMS
jgi:hypothetical protein